MKSIDELLSIKSIDGPLSTATEHEHASTEHCYRACVVEYFS